MMKKLTQNKKNYLLFIEEENVNIFLKKTKKNTKYIYKNKVDSFKEMIL